MGGKNDFGEHIFERHNKEENRIIDEKIKLTKLDTWSNNQFRLRKHRRENICRGKNESVITNTVQMLRKR